MDWKTLIGPAVVAAIISGLVAIIGFWISSRITRAVHGERLAFEREQTERRVTAEIALAEKKVALDRAFETWKRRADLAEETISDFYELRDIMKSVRSPASYEGEGRTRRRDPNESEEMARSRDTYFAILERLNSHRETIAKLMSRQYRMVALFGKDAAEPFKLLYGAIGSVTVSARMLIRCTGETDRPPSASFRKWEADIWSGHDPDPVGTKIDQAVDAIEWVCGPILEAGS